MATRYSLKNFIKLTKQPEYVLWELQRVLFNLRTGEGIDVMDQDWDNLILLDACRYDAFEAQNTIDGDLEPVLSGGGSSWEFMEANFVDRELHDTVYVTANPHTGKLADDVFHAVEMLHIERWNDEYETVLPDVVLEEALEAHERYPNKRLIVHFMQPHRPYIGPTGRELNETFDLNGYNRALSYQDEVGVRDENAFSALVECGEIPIPKLREAYFENLEIVLDATKELVDTISGKTVISADHGEMLGERITRLTQPKFGHSPQYFKNSELFIVPWLEVESDNRRAITPDKPTKIDRGSNEEIQERLRALGYK